MLLPITKQGRQVPSLKELCQYSLMRQTMCQTPLEEIGKKAGLPKGAVTGTGLEKYTPSLFSLRVEMSTGREGETSEPDEDEQFTKGDVVDIPTGTAFGLGWGIAFNQVSILRGIDRDRFRLELMAMFPPKSEALQGLIYEQLAQGVLREELFTKRKAKIGSDLRVFVSACQRICLDPKKQQVLTVQSGELLEPPDSSQTKFPTEETALFLSKRIASILEPHLSELRDKTGTVVDLARSMPYRKIKRKKMLQQYGKLTYTPVCNDSRLFYAILMQ